MRHFVPGGIFDSDYNDKYSRKSRTTVPHGTNVLELQEDEEGETCL